MGNRDRRSARPVEARRLIVQPAAQRELSEALAWSRRHFGAITAGNLLQRFEKMEQALLREPGLGTTALQGTRRLSLRLYPYTLVYRVSETAIHVITLRHQSRLPWP